MAFALTFIGVVADVLFSALFRHIFGVLLIGVAVYATFVYIRILGGR